MVKTQATVDFVLWILFCRSLVDACAVEDPLTGRGFRGRAKEIRRLSGDVSGQLIEGMRVGDPNEALDITWGRLIDWTCIVLGRDDPGDSSYKARVARRTLSTLTTTLSTYDIERIDSSSVLETEAMPRSLGPNLRRATDKASRFWGYSSGTCENLPSGRVMPRSDNSNGRGFAGFGALTESRPRQLIVKWTTAHQMGKRGQRRDIEDYVRFAVALTHEVAHCIAPGAEFDRTHDSQAIHGWLTYLQIMDAYDVARLRRGAIATLMQDSLGRLLNKDEDESYFDEEYFGENGRSSLTGWNLASELSSGLASREMGGCLDCSCPYYHRAGRLSTYALMHVLTRHNCGGQVRSDLMCCLSEPLNGTKLRGCEPLKQFWVENQSLFQPYVARLETMFEP